MTDTTDPTLLLPCVHMDMRISCNVCMQGARDHAVKARKQKAAAERAKRVVIAGDAVIKPLNAAEWTPEEWRNYLHGDVVDTRVVWDRRTQTYVEKPVREGGALRSLRAHDRQPYVGRTVLPSSWAPRGHRDYH